MPKPLSLAGWKKKAWSEFSKYIRQRGTNDMGINTCFTCLGQFHWKEMNAGHYKHNHLDYDEININAQCVRCNKWLSGNLGNYAVNLIKKYGLEKVDDLIEKAEKEIYQKRSKVEYEEIYLKYRELNKEKNIIKF